jgi:hypothetical protein
MNKKAIWAVIIVAICLIGGIFTFQYVVSNEPTGADLQSFPSSTSPTADWKTYTSETAGFRLSYPQALTLQQQGSQVVFNHSIPYKNSNGGCDMSGNIGQFERLDDFNLTLEVVPTQSPSYVDGTYEAGMLKGSWAYQGAEGCGEIFYYFPLPNNKTLLVKKASIQALSGISTAWNKEEILKIPGVITAEQSDIYLRKVLESFVLL